MSIRDNDRESDQHPEPKNSETLKYRADSEMNCSRVVSEARDMDIDQIICNSEVLESYLGYRGKMLV